jgi:hypothetical protein
MEVLNLGFGLVPDLGLLKRLRIAVFGYCFLRWEGYNAVYVVRCRKHGLFLDMPHGYTERFFCRDCFVEARRERL